jgi:hypothetical protein
MFHADELLELLRLAGLEETLPLGVVDHLRRLRGLACALAWTKREGQRGAFSNAVRALFQAAVMVLPSDLLPCVKTSNPALDASRVTWIPVDGAATPEQVERVKTFLPPLLAACSVQELETIEELVDASKAFGDVALPFAFLPPAPLPIGSEWSSIYTPEVLDANKETPVSFCTATCRPRYIVLGAPENTENTVPRPRCVQQNERTWVEAVESVFHVAPSQLVSLYNLYGMFVEKFSVFPETPQDMLVFLVARILSPTAERKHSTLPAHAEQMVADFLNKMRAVRARVPDPLEFARRWNNSRPIDVRVAIERGADRSTDVV